MTISTRLMRAGLACLVFGACASLLPSNGGIVMADSTACPNCSLQFPRPRQQCCNGDNDHCRRCGTPLPR